MNSNKLLRLLAPLLLLFASCVSAGPAVASPGAYRVLVVFVDDDPPRELQQQIAAQPGVAAVDVFEAGIGFTEPSPAQLATYDLVVDVPDFTYADETAYGNSLADYLDAGGVLVQFAYDSWDDGTEGNGPEGRFSSGGYAPFLYGPNENESLTLGTFDAASPLMQGVGPLNSGDNTEPGLAPGATLVAQWDNGANAIAYKGNVVSVSAYTGDEEIDAGAGEPEPGNYGRLVVNAVRWLGRQTLSVSNLNPVGGTVTGSGILCGPACSLAFKHNTPVSLAGVANPGYAFAGFSGACAGVVCNLAMDVPKAVAANFYAFGIGKKVRKNKKKGTAMLSFGVGGPGAVVLSSRKVKKKSKAVTQAGRVKLLIVAKGKSLKALRSSGKAQVKVQVAFTPTGGSTALFTRKVTLRLQSSS